MNGVHPLFLQSKNELSAHIHKLIFQTLSPLVVSYHTYPLWIGQLLLQNYNWYYCFNTFGCVIFIMDILCTRHVVLVQLEVAWMGANGRTAKKANNNKTVCRFWGQKSISQGHRNSLPLGRTKTSSRYRWLASAVMSRITNRLNNRLKDCGE